MQPAVSMIYSLLVILQVNEPASSVNTSVLGKLHSFFCAVALSSCCVMAIGVKLKTCARLKIWYCAFSPTEHCASERSVLLLYIVKHNVVLQTCLNLLSYKLCLFEHCRSTYCGLLDMHVSLRGIKKICKHHKHVPNMRRKYGVQNCLKPTTLFRSMGSGHTVGAILLASRWSR